MTIRIRQILKTIWLLGKDKHLTRLNSERIKKSEKKII
jgi:hypothetical protein